MRHYASYRVNGGGLRHIEFESKAKTRAGVIRAARNAASIRSLFEPGETFGPDDITRMEVRSYER